MNKYYPHKTGFTLIELLIVITIIGVLMSLTVITLGPIQKKSRDSRRKADISSMRAGLDLFKADFKVYPNTTFYLGTNTTDTGAVNSSFGLGNDISQCKNQPNADPSLFATDTANLNNAVMLEGFEATNSFLICMKYMEQLVQDPTYKATPTDARNYHYRVTADYEDMLIGATLENPGVGGEQLFSDSTATERRYWAGTGRSARQLDEDSNTSKFFTGLGLSGTVSDGKYLYQCLKKLDGSNITKDQQSSSTYQPLVIVSGNWAANSACQNALGGGGVKVIQAFGRSVAGGVVPGG